MFKKITAAALSFFMVTSLCGCSLTERDIIDTTYETEVPPRMLFLGDSIAAGYGLDGYTSSDNYNCESYSNILKERYTAELSDICKHEMQNFAVSGNTSDDLIELIDSGKLDSALAESDAVVVSIGGNDMLHIMFDLFKNLGISSKDSFDIDNIDILGAVASLITMDSEIDEALDEFEINLKEISSKLNEKSDGTIYVQTLYNPLETFDNIPMVVDFSEEKIGRFNEIVRNNAQEGYTVIDLADDFEGKCDTLTRIGSIDIHPNEEGHKVIAEAVDEAFRATGFTYTAQEYGEPHLTLSSILLILGGICAMLLVTLLIIPKLFKSDEKEKDKNKDKKEKSEAEISKE